MSAPPGALRIPRIMVDDQPLDIVSQTGVLTIIEKACKSSWEHVVVRSVNTHSLADRARLAGVLADDSVDLYLLDSRPISLLLRRHRFEVQPVPGADLLPLILESASINGFSVGLIGPSSRTVGLVRGRLGDMGVRLAFAISPSPEEVQVAIGTRGANFPSSLEDVDIVIVSLSSPKQEQLIAALGNRRSHGLTIGLGAAADFLVGVQPRAPKRIRRLGLEWAWRASTGGIRMSYRYLVRDLSAELRIVAGILLPRLGPSVELTE